MGLQWKFLRAAALGWAGFSILCGCDPIPAKKLTAEQKTADMLWLYAQFDENYAPLDYKMSRLGLSYDGLKQQYLTKALATQKNDDFYWVMHQFVAEFQDAHTRASLSHGGLPNRAKMAYIGISGIRKGTVFVVKELLPTYDPSRSSFPIRVGDEILEMDGKSLDEVIKSDLVSYQNLGQEVTNSTFHMNRIFTRITTLQPLPEREDAVLTIVKRDYTFDEKELIESRENRKLEEGEKKKVNLQVTVPWVVKDVYEFNLDQRRMGASMLPAGIDIGALSPFDFFQLQNEKGEIQALMGLKGFDGNIQLPHKQYAQLLPNMPGYRFTSSFFVPELIQSWTTQIPVKTEGSSTQLGFSAAGLLRQVRAVPQEAHFITNEDANFPTFITSEKVHEVGTGKSIGNKLVATMFLPSFSLGSPEEDVINEFNTTLDTLQFFGVKDLIIDLLNNGGGSLSLGLRLAQSLSPKKVDVPQIQLKVSETWLENFESASLQGASDAEREVARRVHSKLLQDYQLGKKLSEPMSTEILMPFEMIPNGKLKKRFNIILLTNEMCASMCDIFSAMLQDNQLAKTLGTKTMGAGGNVVNHFQAPNSHLEVRQTESLIIRTDANHSYIENQGIEPDYPVDANAGIEQRYRPIWREAIWKLTEGKKKKTIKTSGISLGNRTQASSVLPQ